MKELWSLFISLTLPSSLSVITFLSVLKFSVQISLNTKKLQSYKELNQKCSISYDEGAVKKCPLVLN